MPARVPVPQLPLPASDAPLFAKINAYVNTYMSSPSHDASHDYQHVLRVLSNAHKILLAERAARPEVAYDTTAVYLAALLHDVGDHKYIAAGEEAHGGVKDVLISSGAEAGLAAKVEAVVLNVSFSHEKRNPDAVAAALSAYPELGIVQDADRLDAIGAVGVGRAFSYGAAKCPGEPMQRAVNHYEEKLYRIEGMMKTGTGKEMARKRTEVLRVFEEDWRGECELGFELQ
jgi:uncharacterized protein